MNENKNKNNCYSKGISFCNPLSTLDCHWAETVKIKPKLKKYDN